MNRYYQRLIEDSEKRVDFIFKFQVMDPKSMDYGGVSVEKKYVEPKLTMFIIAAALSTFLNEKSKYYRDKELFERIELGLDYSRRMQREDGTFDLLSCNFYAAPDTAFCMQAMLPSYRLLERYGFDEDCTRIKNKIYTILKDAAYGMAIGGFHTPNHRWAISSMLMACYNLFHEEVFREKAEEYLKEGIDFSEDGEYAERSAAIYNVVNNYSMIMFYEETGDEKYLQYVARNLDMMTTYFEPDGSIFTNNSTRQDRGQKIYPNEYFYQYLYMAQKYNHKVFEAVAHKIIDDLTKRAGEMTPDCLGLLMLHENLQFYPLLEYGFPEKFQKHYPESGVLRARKNGFSYSIVKGSNSFLYFQSGSLALDMRIGACYCEHRFFKIQEWENTGDSDILKFKARGWYYLPFEQAPDTSDWWKMHNESRKKIYKKDLEIAVTVTPSEKGLSVNIKAGGCDRVPLRVEIGLPGRSTVESEVFYSEGSPGDALLLRKGSVTVTKGMDRITVGPGFGTHQFIHGKFGSEGRGADNFTLYFTDFTDFDRTIQIEKIF